MPKFVIERDIPGAGKLPPQGGPNASDVVVVGAIGTNSTRELAMPYLGGQGQQVIEPMDAA